METIGAFDAKTHLSKLLERVEKGESFVITKHGRPVAELKPVRRHDVAKAREAAERIRALAKELKLGPFDWEEWKAYRDEGRE